MDIKTVNIDDDNYPEHLRSIPKAPETLYYIGDIKLIEHPLIAIVGTRRCSTYGRWAAEGIAYRIASCGISVVSGMAEGIDSAAHRGCIKAGTPTVAVLGTGIDICFPKSNLELYRRIAEDGLIEHAGYCGHYYGTPKAFVEEKLNAGKDVIPANQVNYSALYIANPTKIANPSDITAMVNKEN